MEQYYARGPHTFFDIAPLKYSSWEEYEKGVAAILKKYMKLENAEELQETYNFYVKMLAEKPYPTAKGIQTILDWSKRADARKANPAQFIQTKVVEKLDKQGFIDVLYRK